jgi:chromosome segregation ATPase
MASAMIERLAKEQLQRQRREAEALDAARKLEQIVAERDALRRRIAEADERRERVTALRERLLQRNAELRTEMAAAHAEDARAREALRAELTATVDSVNREVETTNVAFGDATVENARWKEKLEALRASVVTGDAKLQDLVERREADGRNLGTRADELERTNAALREQIEAQDEPLALLRAEHGALTAEMESYSARFTDAQTRLTEANSVFAAAKQDQERGARRLNAIDAERADTIRRLERTHRDRDVAVAEEAQTDRQRKTLEAQIASLQTLLARLRGEPEPPAPPAEGADDHVAAAAAAASTAEPLKGDE